MAGSLLVPVPASAPAIPTSKQKEAILLVNMVETGGGIKRTERDEKERERCGSG
jgi:hypothetical protein